MILEYTITEDKNYEILVLKGELIDKNQATDLIKKVDELLEAGKTKWIINLEELKYMNSSGLNVLIQLLTKTRTRGGESVICHVSKKVNELLIITKLNTLFKIVETKEEAAKILG